MERKLAEKYVGNLEKGVAPVEERCVYIPRPKWFPGMVDFIKFCVKWSLLLIVALLLTGILGGAILLDGYDGDKMFAYMVSARHPETFWMAAYREGAKDVLNRFCTRYQCNKKFAKQLSEFYPGGSQWSDRAGEDAYGLYTILRGDLN